MSLHVYATPSEVYDFASKFRPRSFFDVPACLAMYDDLILSEGGVWQRGTLVGLPDTFRPGREHRYLHHSALLGRGGMLGMDWVVPERLYDFVYAATDHGREVLPAAETFRGTGLWISNIAHPGEFMTLVKVVADSGMAFAPHSLPRRIEEIAERICSGDSGRSVWFTVLSDGIPICMQYAYRYPLSDTLFTVFRFGLPESRRHSRALFGSIFGYANAIGCNWVNDGDAAVLGNGLREFKMSLKPHAIDPMWMALNDRRLVLEP